MTAVFSTTFDDQYLFYLPITVWCWNKLGVDTICFLPQTDNQNDLDKLALIASNEILTSEQFQNRMRYFSCPEHKKATYAQCSRLYASAVKELPFHEYLVTTDIDMLLFQKPPLPINPEAIAIFGSDLVPEKQYPMCYAVGRVDIWRNEMQVENKTYQEKLDELLGHIECEGFRGNYWGKDQETLYNEVNHIAELIPRARPGTQFATNRLDRDDSFFKDRLSPDIIDYHAHRPGYTDDNFEKILDVLNYFYPQEDLGWLKTFHSNYKKLM